MKLNAKHIVLIVLAVLLVLVGVFTYAVYDRMSGLIQMFLGPGNSSGNSDKTPTSSSVIPSNSSVSTSTTVTTQAPLPHTHDFKKEKTVKPTCTDIGYTIYACSCGEKILENKPAKGHTWGEDSVFSGTCLTEGHLVQTCTVCKHTTQVTVATGPHTFGEWEPANPEIGSAAQEQRLCQLCGAIEFRYINSPDSLPLQRYPATEENGYLTYKLVAALTDLNSLPTYQIYIGLDNPIVYYDYTADGLTLYYHVGEEEKAYIAPATGNHFITIASDGNVTMEKPAAPTIE